MPAPREVLAGWLRYQAKGCAELGWPFYAGLLESAAADVEAGGAVLGALPNEATFEVRLGAELLATSRAHGTGVRWLVS